MISIICTNLGKLQNFWGLIKVYEKYKLCHGGPSGY